MPETYHVDIEIAGTINNQEFTGSGHSVGDPALGNPEVTITYSRIPDDSNVLGNFIAIINMLSTLLSKEVPPAKSFLSLTGGNYGFSRSVEGPNVRLYAFGNMRRLRPNNLVLRSTISGKISQGISGTVGKWQGVQMPEGPGRVRESMVIPISFSDGTTETVFVVTNYTFDPSVNLPSLQVREIELNYRISEKTLSAKFNAAIRTATTAPSFS
jgi:hypothetical protein